MNFNREKGLTLIELLITIAVIAIVAAISIPVITNVIDSARTSSAGSMEAQVNAFVEKYAASGEVTFDGIDTFTGWVDLNANGQVDENEAIETFKVDTAQFSLPATLDSSAPKEEDSYTDENIFPGLPSEISITAGEAEGEQATGLDFTFAADSYDSNNREQTFTLNGVAGQFFDEGPIFWNDIDNTLSLWVTTPGDFSAGGYFRYEPANATDPFALYGGSGAASFVYNNNILVGYNDQDEIVSVHMRFNTFPPDFGTFTPDNLDNWDVYAG